MKFKKGFLFIVFWLSLAVVFFERPPDCSGADFDSDLTDLSIEELMNIDITLVARKPQSFLHSAAAVFVITENDIRRSGVTSIPEALRMVPGLQVARIDGNKWAISSRGFNLRFANKLLVLMDGRTIYSPLFSGVYWDAQDTMMEDIERIEVIRGPGASLWGSNAVNGIINIITKHSKDTQGGLISSGIGTEEKGFCSMRYGGGNGKNETYRLYAKYFNRDGQVNENGDNTSDDWEVARGGFRSDWTYSEKSLFTLQGDIYDGEEGDINDIASLEPPYHLMTNSDEFVSGGNVMGKLQHYLSPRSDLTLQLYYDRLEKEGILYSYYADILDIDFHHRFSMGDRQEFIWGFMYRFNQDDMGDSFQLQFEPESETDDLFSAFIQDDIILRKDLLRLTLGSKFEHNAYTGLEVQPNARILWTPHPDHAFWAAVSRAMRTPSRYEQDIKFIKDIYPPNTTGNPSSIALPFPLATLYSGNRESKSEKVIAYELGYRTQAIKSLFWDATAFYNVYDDLAGYKPGAFSLDPHEPVHFVQTVEKTYPGEGDSFGIELSSNWQPLPFWHLQLTYTYLEMDINLKNDVPPRTATYPNDYDPKHQWSIRSSANVSANTEFDIWVRYVDDVEGLQIEDYTTMDARISWHYRKNVELSLVGANLLDSQHSEFHDVFFISENIEIERSVYGKIVWRF